MDGNKQKESPERQQPSENRASGSAGASSLGTSVLSLGPQTPSSSPFRQAQDKGVTVKFVVRTSKFGTRQNRQECGEPHGGRHMYCSGLVVDLEKHLPAGEFASLADKLKAKGSWLNSTTETR